MEGEEWLLDPALAPLPELWAAPAWHGPDCLLQAVESTGLSFTKDPNRRLCEEERGLSPLPTF